MKCDGGYVPNESKTSCTDIMTFTSRFLPIIKNYDLIIEPNFVDPQDLTEKNIKEIEKQETENNMVFIQQALRKIYQDAESY